MSTALKKTCLVRSEARKLEDMVEQHRKEFEEGKWTYASFAEHTMRNMKRPLTGKNVESACRTMGIHVQRKNGPGSDRRLDDLRRATSDLAHQMLMMMNAIDLEPEQEFLTAKEWLDEAQKRNG